jgi:hypothetical protein
MVEELQRDVPPNFEVELGHVEVDHLVMRVELGHLVLGLVLVEHGVLLANVRILLP